MGLLLAPLGVFGITESITTLEGFPVSANFYISSMVIAAIISGIIYGAIYSLFYESIPGEPLRKGVYWGLIVWVIKDISAGMFMVSFGASFLALTFIITGLPMWIVFGVILGAIYERISSQGL
ncbi:hypothetical protein AKJ40_04995 [candidate division MSBL1 archaeon SCGC-AAA259M10]|uniref:Uncharacterized protein n=1 Tax=candidate division MSBL1 archaeon SCGC-AAA259M10 TaxID=1698270 RepID=A0A133UUV5_9EURY|nr:hypothetical protein AKJ40_04995 [candidate division MSBL1 archaeon SCGC-AAA259M10]